MYEYVEGRTLAQHLAKVSVTQNEYVEVVYHVLHDMQYRAYEQMNESYCYRT